VSASTASTALAAKTATKSTAVELIA
jgi:hypothetical protein